LSFGTPEGKNPLSSSGLGRHYFRKPYSESAAIQTVGVHRSCQKQVPLVISIAAKLPGCSPGLLTRRIGADKAYDSKDFVRTVRELNVTPHVTKNDKGRRSSLDRRTTRQPGYAISLSRRWLIEKGFGWLKQTGPLRQVKLRGLEKVDWLFVFSCAAYNLIRLPKLITQPPGRLMEQCA